MVVLHSRGLQYADQQRLEYSLKRSAKIQQVALAREKPRYGLAKRVVMSREVAQQLGGL